MAFKRRSLALTLIAVGFAAQWVPWARIDRAAFQYHYYTALPFVVMSLAYLMAEIWHGASKRTWQAARLAAGLAIMGPALLWLLDRPLCWFVGVEIGQPGLGGLPGGHPDHGHHRPDARARGGRHRRRSCCWSSQFLELDEADGSRDTDRWRSFTPLAADRAGRGDRAGHRRPAARHADPDALQHLGGADRPGRAPAARLSRDPDRRARATRGGSSSASSWRP